MQKALISQNKNIIWLPSTSHSSVTSFQCIRNPCVIDGDGGCKRNGSARKVFISSPYMRRKNYLRETLAPALTETVARGLTSPLRYFSRGLPSENQTMKPCINMRNMFQTKVLSPDEKSPKGPETGFSSYSHLGPSSGPREKRR